MSYSPIEYHLRDAILHMLKTDHQIKEYLNELVTELVDKELSNGGVVTMVDLENYVDVALDNLSVELRR